ncbi:hypothetical protein GR239_13655 [Rhizobium leguminosarum]|uniref:hypothetical protein n=1 Tax=Rhizobium ruizarguesonis TaxID=2081791 RepID=UPI00103EC34F|nr:hypothetical protein [Rhizobium ruizarguesonis]MBY5845463.1 hypothetical protein [Rhizobium leguminosarum]TCB15139.1 hypothetical protein E0J18_17790 [Rhizobium leguminosarum bv. viciae]NEH85382.1 hypothetical protein [Rhizobium ruizarguesonis]NEI13846.1 hypothetical protein [Rhizobium ruizarguesonis]NEJ57585.1 hypothetical protein [Rhizobium ruizarguesonis]
MSRGDWREYVKDGTVVILAIAAFCYILENGEEYYQDHYAVIKNQSSLSQSDPAGIPSSTINSDVKIYSEKDLEYKNSIIQERVANFAYWTVIVGFLGVLLSFGALWGLFRSLRQTKIAIGDNREFGEKQTRAYLFTKKSIVTPSADAVTITVELENTGVTPAYHVQLGLAVLSGREEDLSDNDFNWRNMQNIGGNQISKFHYSIPIATWNEISNTPLGADINLFVNGMIKYNDTFGKSRWTRFRHLIPKDGHGNLRIINNGLVISENGNDTEIDH